MARHYPFNDNRWIEYRWATGKPTPRWLDMLHVKHPRLDRNLNVYVLRWFTRREVGA